VTPNYHRQPQQQQQIDFLIFINQHLQFPASLVVLRGAMSHIIASAMAFLGYFGHKNHMSRDSILYFLVVEAASKRVSDCFSS